jgi:hypothetical protein
MAGDHFLEAAAVMTNAIPALNEIRTQLAPEMNQPRQLELWHGK